LSAGDRAARGALPHHARGRGGVDRQVRRPLSRLTVTQGSEPGPTSAPGQKKIEPAGHRGGFVGCSSGSVAVTRMPGGSSANAIYQREVKGTEITTETGTLTPWLRAGVNSAISLNTSSAISSTIGKPLDSLIAVHSTAPRSLIHIATDTWPFPFGSWKTGL